MQTSALLAAIVAASDDAIVSKDLNGIITSWNNAAERMFGYSSSEAIGQPITIIIPADRLHEEAEVIASIRRGEAVDHLETVRRRKDGTQFDISVTISPIRDSDGTIIGASKIARDISEQKRAARRLREEMRIVETLNRVGSTVASTLDRDGVVQAVINAVTDLTDAAFGVLCYRVPREDGEEFIRQSLSGPSKDAFAQLPPSLAIELFRPTLDGERSIRISDIAKEARFAEGLLNDGSPELPMRSYLAVPVVSAAGQVLAGLFFGHPDVDRFTERHQRLTEGIAGWAAVALENARFYEEANEANRMKDEFLAVLSHELRTPLNAIMGWADMLTGTTMDDDSRLRALRSIQRNARIQAQLIEDLLDVSRIVAGKLALRHEHLDLAVVVSAAIEDLRAEIKDKRLALSATIAADSMVVTGDAQRLQQIVWNLLSNAIKFTQVGGSIEVGLTKTDTHAQIVVRDSGQGIAAEFLPHVFDRFRQADSSTTRRFGGLGLGLGIVKHLIEAHAGTVTASSEGIGKGATFTVRLPLRRYMSHVIDTHGSELPLSATQLPDVRALVVDDDRDAADLLVYALVQCGAHVSAVPSALEGLRALGRESFNLLLADIGMPDVDGYQLIRTIRARENDHKGPTLAAIAITAHAGPGDRERALAAGFDWHLTKPVAARDVIAVIARVTSAARSRRP